MSLSSTILLIERILALALLQQTIELLVVRKAWTKGGIWTGSPFSDSVLTASLYLRVLLALTLLFSANPILLWTLLATNLLLFFRWRGTYNGGSDAMTSIVLLALCVAVTFPYEQVIRGCLWYIAIQVCLSYFISGFQKIRRRDWHTGKALTGFLSSTTLDVPAPLRSAIQNPQISFVLAWLVMIFECLFPLALFNSTLCVLFIGMGFIFHLTNTYALGLNRFILAWLAAYPALYFCSQIW